MNVRITPERVASVKLAGVVLLVAGIGFGISLNAAGLGVYAAALFVQALWLRERPMPRIPGYPFLIVLLAFLGVNLAIHHDYLWVSLRGLAKYVGGFLTMVAVIDVAGDRKKFFLLFKWLLVVYGIVMLAALCQKWAGIDFIRFRQAYLSVSPARLCGPFRHYNDFGTFLVAGLAASLAFSAVSVLKKRKTESALGIVLFGSLFFVLVNTFSRSAFVAAGSAIFVFLCLFKSRRFTLPFFLLVFGVIALGYAPLAERLGHIFSLTRESSAERLLLAEISVKMIRQCPLIGLGMNTYSIYFPQFKPETYQAFKYAHDSYLQISAEIGLVGMALFLLYIAVCVRMAWRALQGVGNDPEFRILGLGFLCAVVGLLVNACFESLLQSTQLRSLFWTVMGFMLASAFHNAPPPSR